uniref:Conserved plasma membrane protein n=1 Tax=Ascaris lumbricoides TaxID=6252 RepID=A0A0M3HMP7_ASCLU
MTANEVNGSNNYENSMAALDRYIAPGLRLWMLIALVSGVLLVMVVLVCCFMRIRIPRTKRQIDLIAARRKMRNQANIPAHPPGNIYERTQTIVMNTLKQAPRSGREKEIESQPLVHNSSHTTTTV